MITVAYSTHKDKDYNKEFKEHLNRYVGLKDVQILEYQNNNEFSLAHVYNKAIEESKYNIVVCVHNDIKLGKDWGKKILKDFVDNPDYGIIGKAGSCYFPKSGVYWENMNETMVGQVYHQPDKQNRWLSRYSTKFNFLIPVITIDGLFIAFDKTKIKHKFDETIGKFHFYDHGFTLPNYLDGVKIGVTSSFDITHQSVGQPNEEFHQTREKFVEKYSNVLPLDLKPQSVIHSKIDIKSPKNGGLTAVIIPTKGNVNLLKDCVNSFIEHCDSNTYEIFIADTGSNDDEKNEIKNFIEENESKVTINLIEYNYYNFAQINNDVVKNHIDDDFKYLLFCNNDIKLLNNVIAGMTEIFRKNPKAGTVGCRLHFGDNTIQHEGVFSYLNKMNAFGLTHIGLRSYYPKNSGINKVSGNTAALLMIKKSTFIKCGYFNESYSTCFEDVELNYKCLTLGLENYCDNNLVAYHLESQTRKKDPDVLLKEKRDFNDCLLPFINNNIMNILPYTARI